MGGSGSAGSGGSYNPTGDLSKKLGEAYRKAREKQFHSGLVRFISGKQGSYTPTEHSKVNKHCSLVIAFLFSYLSTQLTESCKEEIVRLAENLNSQEDDDILEIFLKLIGVLLESEFEDLVKLRGKLRALLDAIQNDSFDMVRIEKLFVS